jgi:hypothetical protein
MAKETKDLGIKDSEYWGNPTMAMPEDQGKPKEEPLRYPNFDLRNAQIERAGFDDVQQGDVLVITAKVFVKRKESEENDATNKKSLGIDIQEILSVENENQNEAESGTTPRKKKKPAPIDYKKAMGAEEPQD